MTIKVGVTGVGGGVGQSILKALELSDLDLEITRIDMQDNAGFYLPSKNKFYNVITKNMRYNSLVYKGEIYESLDCLISGSDYDVEKYAKKRREWKSLWGFYILTSDYDLVASCCDKILTYELLTENNIPMPYTSYDLDTVDYNFPLIIKPCRGSASRGFHILNNLKELLFYQQDGDLFSVFQPYIDGKEYTCSVFCGSDGPVGTFIAERELKNGTTVYAKIIRDEQIEELLVDIGIKLRPRGPLNVQLRRDKDGKLWVIELNPRCSGTTAIRAHFGFNEPDMMISHFVLGEKLKSPKVKLGTAYRYWNEVYV